MKKFKIIHIIHSLAPGGAENLVRTLAQLQVLHGHEVEIVTVGPLKPAVSDPYAAQFIQELADANISWIHVPLPKKGGSLIKQLRPHLNLGEHTIIHCHIFRGLLALTSLAKKNTHVVYTHHNSIYPVSRRILYFIAKHTADAFVSVCNNTVKDAEKYFTGIQALIHNGVDLSLYRSRDSEEIPQEPIKLVNIGSFTKQKNQLKAIECMAELGSGYHLTIFGRGIMEAEMQNAVQNLKITNIDFPGVSMTLSEKLANYDIMMQTSDWEGMPLSLIEGHAAGLPIVATDVGDTASIVDDKLTGYLVSPHAAVSEIVNKIKLTSNLDNYPLLAQAATEKAKDFNIEYTAEEYRKIYESLASKE